MKRFLIILMALIICFTMLFSGCTGSKSHKKENDNVEYMESIDEDNIQKNDSVSSDDVNIVFTQFNNISSSDVSIEEDKNPDVPEELDASVNVYDISVKGKETFDVPIEIVIPYDKEFIDQGEDPDNCIGAGYYNEELGTWEPVSFRIDKDENKVYIMTDHLSKYGVFTFKNPGKRRASVKLGSFGLTMPSKVSNHAYIPVIEESLKNGGAPGEVSMQHGFEIANEALGVSGNALTFITEAMYSTKFLEKMGSVFGEIGLIGALVQAAYDWEKDDGGVALKTNLTKNLSYYAIGKWGLRAAKLCAVGVFAIDYSLNAFITEAWAGREKTYRKAYNLYYDDLRREAKRNGTSVERQLFNQVYEAYQKSLHDSSYDLNKAVQEIVDNFASKFWKLSETDIAEYMSDAGVTFSAGGGLNDKLKKKVADAYALELMQTTMQPIFQQVNRTITYDLEKEYYAKLQELRNELNKITKVHIFESKALEDSVPKYADHIIRFAPLSEDAVVKNWTGRFKEDVNINTSFTLLGYLQGGAPNTIKIFAPDADPDIDEPVKVMEFKFIGEDLEIDLFNAPPTLEQLSGTWDKSDVNRFIPTNIDIPWVALKAAASNNSQSSSDDSEGSEECELADYNIDLDEIKKQIDGMVGQSYPLIFTIDKLDENKGSFKVVDFPGTSQEACEVIKQFAFTFDYDANTGVVKVDKESLRKFVTQTMEFEGVQFWAGESILTARFDKNESGDDIMVFEGSIDFSFKMPQLGENFYMKFDIYGER